MIRKGDLHDQPRIMSIIHDAVTDMESKGIFQWDSYYPNKEVINEDLDKSNLYINEDDGVIKGFIVLNEYQDGEYRNVKWEFDSGRQLVVHRLCIDPRFQRQGIAKLLMNYAEVYGKELGYQSIRLDTFIYNHIAAEFYKKIGYKIAGQVEFRKGKFHCFEKNLNF